MKTSALGLALMLVCATAPARAEVTECNVITALPVIIQSRGVWCLKGDLSWGSQTGRAIDVRESFVTIDLNGFLVSGTGGGTDTQAIGIYSRDRRGITIRNGTIRGFYRGVHVDGSTAHSHLIEDVRFDQIRGFGVTVEGVSTTVRNNRFLHTGGSTFIITAKAIDVVQARTVRLIDNVITRTSGSFASYGISIFGSDIAEVRGNSVLDTFGGDQVYAILAHESTNITIERNRVLNGSILGNVGIAGSGGSGIHCIDNLVARFSTTFTGCTFGSGNLAP